MANMLQLALSRRNHTRNQNSPSIPPPVPHHPKKKMQMDIMVTLAQLDNLQETTVKALLDCGCTSSTISQNFVTRNQIPTQNLSRNIPVYNANGSANRLGPITEHVVMRMRIKDHEERIDFVVTQLQGHDIFIGYDWLQHHNPSIDWKSESN